MPSRRATDEERSATERLLERHSIDRTGLGKPLSEHTRQYQRTLEAYLRAGDPPRWMQRLKEIERGTADHARKLEVAYRKLRSECGDDTRAFARRWREVAWSWSFVELNELIEQHNDWFPIERRLPMSPRTGDYLPVMGRSYRRTPLGPEWVLERYPAEPDRPGP
jgi:hypothetical protein